jgi:putative ABC transport system substrate-binding protein
MNRRKFIAALGSAAAWPVVAQAQQRAMPIIGYVSGRTAESDRSMLAAVRGGLRELGYEERGNLAIEYCFADGQYDRIPALTAEMIQRRVNVILAVGLVFDGPTLDAVRASQIPVVYIIGRDPASRGEVAAINRPGGNITGISTFVGRGRCGLLSLHPPQAQPISLRA